MARNQQGEKSRNRNSPQISPECLSDISRKREESFYGIIEFEQILQLTQFSGQFGKHQFALPSPSGKQFKSFDKSDNKVDWNRICINSLKKCIAICLHFLQFLFLNRDEYSTSTFFKIFTNSPLARGFNLSALNSHSRKYNQPAG